MNMVDLQAMSSTYTLGRDLADLSDHVNGEPYTDAIPMFRCGHLKTADNLTSRVRCKECTNARSRAWHLANHQPVTCPTCGEPLGVGGHTFGYHSGVCEPTTCTCETPNPDGLGECAACCRLVLSHSWHEGRP